MSKFHKLLILLIFIIIIEIIIIFIGFGKKNDTMRVNIPNYAPGKPIVIVSDTAHHSLSLFQENRALKLKV